MDSKDKLLNVNEVAAIFRVTRKTVYNWLESDNGFPQPIRIVSTIRWKESAINEFINKATN